MEFKGTKGEWYTEEYQDNKYNQAAIEEAVEKHSFQVPYDGSNNFYNETKAKSFIKGCEEVLNNIEKYGLVNWQRGGNTIIPTVEYKKMMDELYKSRTEY